MSLTLLAIAAGVLALLAAAAIFITRLRGATVVAPPRPVAGASQQRILFPFAGRALSERALDAALRLARAEGAELVPTFLISVPMRMPLDSAMPRQCSHGMPLLEAVEQRALAFGVPVDARVARGRSYRHALRDLIAHERYDRVVIAASGPHTDGFHGDDIAWLLDTAPGEVVIVRPDHEDILAAA